MTGFSKRIFLGLIAGMAASTLVAATKPGSPGAIDFNRDIRSILSENCFACHGPDENKRKAKLRFDTKEGAFAKTKSGNHAIVPGDVSQSKLVERITSKDPDEVM